jgi:hypothetical protein
MHQHRLNAILQRDSTGITSPTSTTKLQHDNTILETAQLDIATILLDSGTDSRLEEFLDHADDFVVIFVVAERVLDTLFAVGTGFDCGHDRLAGCHGLGDDAEDFGLDVCPVGVAGLGHRNEVGAVEDGGHAFHVQQLGCERGGMRWGEGGAW